MRALGGRLLVLCLLCAGSAWAQSSDDRAAAEDLFRQGRDLMKANQFAEACVKFEQSQRLDPAIGTQLNIANCYEKVGRVASAFVAFSEAADTARKAGDAKHVEFATKHMNELSPKLIRMTVTLAAGADATGLSITRNGKPMAQGLLGVAVPLDPGSYQLVAARAGFTTWKTTVTIDQPGKTISVEIPPLEKEQATTPKPPVVSVTKPPPPPVEKPPTPVPPIVDKPEPEPQVADPGRSRRIAAYGIGAAGVVALGVGTYFGVSTLSTWSDAKSHCDASGCDAQGLQLSDDAHTKAVVCDVFIGIGAAATIGAIVLYVTAPKRPGAVHVVPEVTSRGAGLVVTGGF